MECSNGVCYLKQDVLTMGGDTARYLQSPPEGGYEPVIWSIKENTKDVIFDGTKSIDERIDALEEYNKTDPNDSIEVLQQ